MPAPRLVAPTEGAGQHTRRSFMVFFDQHKTPEFPDGRPWGGQAEAPADPKMNKGIVGELLPISATIRLDDGTLIKGWDAPWLPEAKYIMASVGSIMGNRFKINYSLQIADYKAANERYYRKANEEAMARNLPGVRMYGPVPFQIRAIRDVGDPPKSPKLPEAALGGDPWILGFSTAVNETLKEILDRDNGRLAEALGEAPQSAGDSLAGLEDAELSEIRAFLAERKKGKSTKATSSAA